MTQARPDAKADEEISLIRGIGAGIIGEEEAIKDRDEGGGLFRRSENNRFDVGVSANRAAKDRVAWGDGRAIPSQNGICFRLEGGKSGIAKEADRGTKDLCHSRAGAGVGEGGTIDGLSFIHNTPTRNLRIVHVHVLLHSRQDLRRRKTHNHRSCGGTPWRA